MDMKISGSGQIAPGEYEAVRISGSGRLMGFVRCESFHASGSSRGDAIECKKDFAASGSCGFSQNIQAENLSASGSFSAGGNITVTEKLRFAGGTSCSGTIKCGSLSASGSLTADGDIEAETAHIRGRVNCDGLINAEEFILRFSGNMIIGAIGGGTITVTRLHRRKKHLFSFLRRTDDTGTVTVKNSIEGNRITLDHVTAPTVSGNVVVIGENCTVDLVQYTEQVEISPDAKVEKVEKIG